MNTDIPQSDLALYQEQLMQRAGEIAAVLRIRARSAVHHAPINGAA
jgi:hypothetical protein